MKKKLMFYGIVILMLCFGGTATASTVYYTVDATITDIYNSTGLQYSEGSGDLLHYILEIDLERPGEQTNSTGITYQINSSKYYYADLFSGDIILPVYGNGFTVDNSWKELNYVYLPFGKAYYPDYMQVYTGWSGSVLCFNLYYPSMTVKNYLHYYDSNGNSRTDQFDMVINKMELLQTNPVAPIPEPTTVFIFGIGIVGILGKFIWKY